MGTRANISAEAACGAAAAGGEDAPRGQVVESAATCGQGGAARGQVIEGAARGQGVFPRDPVVATPSAPAVAAGAARSCSSRVLVVDDEAAIADLVASLLAAEGVDVQAAYCPRDALALFEKQPFDLVILDIMMPEMDGFELCARLRTVSDVPIMFLSARDEETDQVVGFALGADDYVTKPFKPRELVARVKARLRRARNASSSAPSGSNDHIIRVRGIEIDLHAHKATLHDEPLVLTPKEFAILQLLAQRAGSPVSACDIFEEVWGERYDAAANNTVMVHIRHVRKKLAAIDSATTFIETAWGVGYCLLTDAETGARAALRQASSVEGRS